MRAMQSSIVKSTQEFVATELAPVNNDMKSVKARIRTLETRPAPMAGAPSGEFARAMEHLQQQVESL
eukprot:2301123-Heterocapsa_arctica.AAC.1